MKSIQSNTSNLGCYVDECRAISPFFRVYADKCRYMHLIQGRYTEPVSITRC
jgi:hypothetical protein